MEKLLCEFSKDDLVPNWLYQQENCIAHFGTNVEVYKLDESYSIYPKNIDYETCIYVETLDKSKPVEFNGAPTCLYSIPKKYS